MNATAALKLTVAQRLGFEVTLARATVERAYKQMQDDLHGHGRYNDSAMIALHEAERTLAALERVSGDFYRQSIANAKAYREEQKRYASECAAAALESAKGLP